MDHFTVRTMRETDGSVVLIPAGELDIDTRSALDSAVAFLPPSLAVLRLAMDRVSFMDVAGIHFLTALQRRCEDRQTTLEVYGLRPQASRLLALAEVDLAGVIQPV
jgi:anti-anti-sigma factor